MTPRGPLSATFVLLACLAFTAACGRSDLQQHAPPQPIAPAQQNGSTWVELGTQSGPIPSGVRSEPAHLLLWRDQAILIDVGDGASEQLAKAHVTLPAVQTVFISHLHFDHTGGLYAFLGMRFQGAGPMAKPLTIYGPPGTKALVEALRAAMLPGTALAPVPTPTYTVVELNDKSVVTLGDLKVTAATNSHYRLWNSAGPAPVSLSYRFDMPGRSIVYTGDTGPSSNVEQLAKNADLLVSEIMDADTALATLKHNYPNVPVWVLPFVRDHFTKEHLLPDQVGILAANAGVHALVLTHFGGATGDKEQIVRLTKVIAAHYKGPITFANDMDRF